MSASNSQGLSYRFDHAIARRPSESCVMGLRAEDRGAPDPALFEKQHDGYLRALEEEGLKLTVLEPLEDFPDSVFVEDPALCLPEGAVLLRPGAESRRLEAEEIAPALSQHYGEVIKLEGPGFVDGGDIMVTDTEVLIGLSKRTNAEGIEELAGILSGWSYDLRPVETPKGVLHFKSDSAPLGDGRILSTKRLADSGCFTGYDVLLVPEGEEAAANALRINDRVFLAEGFPRTNDLLEKAGYRVIRLPLSEAAKLDGGLSCLSLRFKKRS